MVVAACFALNPNVLYLASIPMTEVVFLAGLAVLLFALLRFRETQRIAYFALGVASSWAMSLTRFDAWFLIPFTALAFGWFAKRKQVVVLIGSGALAGLVPLYWMAHSWWQSGNALDFYNGPYSAAAIQGPHSYPGYHDWPVAVLFYAKAGQLCAGWCLVLLGLAGCLIAAKKQTGRVPILFLCLTPAFYVWAVHSSKVPIYVPQLYFGSYYNLRYGIAVVAFSAFAAGAVVLAIPEKWRRFGFAIPLLAAAAWLVPPSKDNWVCWKESQVNSEARRAWTKAGADFYETNYRPGERILTSSGDVMGIMSQAGIPLRETLSVNNGVTWLATTTRPDLLHRELWVVAQQGDLLWQALSRQRIPIYQIVKTIRVKGAPPLVIYRKTAERSQ